MFKLEHRFGRTIFSGVSILGVVNTAYTELIRAKITGMLHAAAAVRAIDHHGVVGQLREFLIRQILEPLLPQYIGATTGVIVSAWEQQSSQLDAVMFDRRSIPPA